MSSDISDSVISDREQRSSGFNRLASGLGILLLAGVVSIGSNYNFNQPNGPQYKDIRITKHLNGDEIPDTIVYRGGQLPDTSYGRDLSHLVK